MKATDLIRWAMQLTDQGTAHLVSDMKNAALTPSTPGAKGGDGNHTLWLLGHLAVVEGGLRTILLGKPNPVEHWAPLFAAGTKPTSDASAYPPFDEVLNTYRKLRAENLKMLEEFSDADLDRAPKQVPPEFADVMTSFGNTMLLISLHNMVHYGQIADARRVAGRTPLM